MGPQSSILGELLIIGLTSDTTSMLDLRTLADWTIRPRLLSTGGVAQVAVLGGDIKEYQVLLDPARMKHYNVTLAEVMNVTRNMNQNANGGVIYEYGNEYIVRGVLSSHDVDQLSRSVIKTVEGVPVTLEDIADVKIGSQEPKLGTASERGKPAVLLTVTKQPKTGTIELTEQLEAALKDLQKNLPADVHVSTDIFRQSRFIESSIGNVKDSLYEGAVFCGDCSLPVPCQCTYHGYFIGNPSVVIDCFYIDSSLYGTHHQYHEFGWYGHCHWFVGG